MKILHLQTELNLTCGITRTISQIVNNTSIKFEHHLIAFGGNALSRFQGSKIKLKVVSIRHLSIVGTLKLFLIIFNYSKENSIHVIHSHHRYFDTLVWFLKPITKIKTVTSVQSKVYGKKYYSYKADKLIACSKTIKYHLINNFNVDDHRIEVIYNTVDSTLTKLFTDKEQLKKELKIGLEEFVIGFVGRIDYKEKGVDVLLDAFNILSKEKFNVRLLIIGDGPNQLEVEEYCEINKIKATLLSSKENIFDYYNLMDLIVLPSRIDPFPLTMLETALMKRPFIGSNVDGIGELIESGKDGLLFEPGNIDELKRQIVKIIEDKKYGLALAGNLNNKVLTSFTIQEIIPKYEKIYKDVLQNGE